MTTSSEPLLHVEGLTVSAPGGRILDGVGLELHRGHRLGLIGESGSGKTTIVRTLIGLLPRGLDIDAGRIDMEGTTVLDGTVDRLSQLRGSGIGTVFQSALTSLHPLRRLESQLDEIIRFHRPALSRDERRLESRQLLEQMGIHDAARVLHAYPHQVSGGQRQRVAIALALAGQPSVVVADECTSALDVRSQAQVVDLLRTVTGTKRGLLFVTHDLALASELCTHVVVLKRGVVVEAGAMAEVLARPQHPYTRSLLAAVPPWCPADGNWPPDVTDAVA
jgi:peptide/nickel transport system ATP-binding protein